MRAEVKYFDWPTWNEAALRPLRCGRRCLSCRRPSGRTRRGDVRGHGLQPEALNDMIQ